MYPVPPSLSSWYHFYFFSCLSALHVVVGGGGRVYAWDGGVGGGGLVL